MSDNAFLNRFRTGSTDSPALPIRRFLDKAVKRPLLFCAACLTALTAFAGGVVAAHMRSAPPLPVPHIAVSVRPDAIPLYTAEAVDPSFAGHPLSSDGRNAFAAAVQHPIDSDAPTLEGASRHVRFPHSRAGLVTLTRGKVRIATEDGPVTLAGLRKAAEAPAHVPASFFSRERAVTASSGSFFGEEKRAGAPWPFLGGFTEEDTLVCRPDRSGGLSPLRRLLSALHLPSTGVNYAARAGMYRNAVTTYADKYNIASTLVLAIMHTESNFNPFAVSPSQAVGLMQVVPETAGSEVHRYLTGIPAAPSLETLFVPEHNIRYGTTYLHLLGSRYFGGVADRASRQLCIIAAYNGGPGAVLRMFDPDDRDAAVAKINTMTPEQVYTALTTQMPNLETRRYVELVTGRMQTYAVN